jgi:ribosome assembly protein 4
MPFSGSYQVANSTRQDPSDRVPYKFHYAREDATEGVPHLDIATDLYHTILQPGIRTTEDVVPLYYTPQAVFRVRAATRCSAAISGHSEAILCTQFSPNSASRLVSGSGDCTARILDSDTGTPVHTLKGHTGHVLVVSYSPDGSLLATGSRDNTVRLWDPATGKELGALKGHKGFIRSLAWEPYHLQAEGRPRLASASKDATVRIWDVVAKRIDEVLTGHKDSVSCVLWGGTGKIYTSSHDKTIKIWTPDGRLSHTLNGHAHWVNKLALSTDSVLRTAYHDHTGKVPASYADKVAKAKERFEKAASVNGEITERLVSASDDTTIFLWTPETTLKPITRLTGHQKVVNHVCFSPDGLLIATASFENHVKLWTYDGKFLFSLRGHVGAVYIVCFSSDSRLLYSSSKDTTVKCWDVRTGKLKHDLHGHKDQVFALDAAADGGAVASGGADKQIRIWKH